jgi:CRISPR-associated endonuclease/helicase Cas3
VLPIELMSLWMAPNETLDRLWNCATGDATRACFPYQRRLALEPWPDLLKIPTGLGKTAGVALAWMHKRLQEDSHTPRRLVWCLPMRTLVEQTARNVDVWLKNVREGGLDPNGRLPFKGRVLIGGEVDDAWIRHPEQPAILIGTQDILLSRALMRGYGVGRGRWPVDFALLHNDALWLFDEVQLMAAGAPTSAQLEAFRRQNGAMVGCRSLWMSATLERDWLETVDFSNDAASLVVHKLSDTDREHCVVRQRLAAPKALAKAKTTVDSAATSGKGLSRNAEALAAEVLKAHRRGKTSLVIVNRVSRAQALYDALKKKNATELLLIHSRFRPAERQCLNQRLAENAGDRGRIVVATQAIEAGVDVTSAVMFTELAPWASLVQRFGRLNRGAEETVAEAFWIDIAPDADKEAGALALPYTPKELEASRKRLDSLKDVSPQTLEPFGLDLDASWQVLRRKDLYGLFDTDPDLTGFDVDVSPYVRGAEDTDLRVFWRTIADLRAGPKGDNEANRPHRSELCAVPLGQAKTWLDKHRGRAFVWDWLLKRWTKLDRLWPGALVLVDAAVGGYDAERGFDMHATSAAVPTVQQVGSKTEPDSFDGDPDTLRDRKVGLSDHLRHVRDEAKLLCKAFDVPSADAEAVITASLWHDLGKAHETFKLRCGLADADEPLAKTPDYNWRMKCPPNRRYFRHELASALAWLQRGPQGEAHDLVAYLIAAHHGKVRMGLRALPDERGPRDEEKRFARGVWDGDRLPSFAVDNLAIPDTVVALDVMELGGGATGRSWATRTHGLLERYGPFRLAFLEALVRIADWRASEAEQKNGEGADD